jgi:acetyl esterase/lipase
VVDPQEVLTRVSEPPDAVVRYAGHECGLIDLFLPPRLTSQQGLESAVPLIVALHGGFWRERWDRRHLRPLANALVDRGFVVAVPEYRRGPASWPLTRDDITTALSVVAGLVEEVAPGLIDSEAAYTLTGHSAGGHLALWGGLHAGPERVRRIVALAPVTDLVSAARTGMGDNAVPDFLGSAPRDQADAYAEADPMRSLPGAVPVVILQGTEDREVPAEANRTVADRLAGADSVAYVELDGTDHFALIDPLSPVFEEVLLPTLTGRDQRSTSRT